MCVLRVWLSCLLIGFVFTSGESLLMYSMASERQIKSLIYPRKLLWAGGPAAPHGSPAAGEVAGAGRDQRGCESIPSPASRTGAWRGQRRQVAFTTAVLRNCLNNRKTAFSILGQEPPASYCSISKPIIPIFPFPGCSRGFGGDCAAHECKSTCPAGQLMRD